MDHVIDAVFARLDDESLLCAGAACRGWAARSRRPEAWHGRCNNVEWARGMSRKDALVRSLRVRGRWRRHRVAVSELACGAASPLCNDGDWLVYRCTAMMPADGAHAWSTAVCVRDLAAGRTVARIGVGSGGGKLAALHRDRARLVLDQNESDSSQYHPTVKIWAPAADGDDRDRDLALGWRELCDVPTMAVPALGGLRWQGDVLLAYTTERRTASFVAEWIDLSGGAPRVAVRRELSADAVYGDGGKVVHLGDTALVVGATAVSVLDPRDPRPGLTPLVRLGDGGRRWMPGEALDDGRHIVTYRRRCRDSWFADCVALWDVRAARNLPVAELTEHGWRHVVCATVRGTVLGWAALCCEEHASTNAMDPGTYRYCRRCRMSLREWDSARGTTEAILTVGTWFPPGLREHSCDCVWGNERFIAVQYADYATCLYGADSAGDTDAPRPRTRPDDGAGFPAAPQRE